MSKHPELHSNQCTRSHGCTGFFRACSRQLLSCFLFGSHISQTPSPFPGTSATWKLLKLCPENSPCLGVGQDALRQLWKLAFPGTEAPPGIRSAQWKEMGWQGEDPGTDFRGAGLVSLHNHLYMARTESDTFYCLLKKIDGERSEWEYPFAVAGEPSSCVLTGELLGSWGKRSSRKGAQGQDILL